MNTHNQFTSSKERIHLLLVLFLSIIFCSCTKEDSPVSIEATSKVVTTRTSQDEYFEHAKLPQIIKIEWSQYIPFPPLLNIQIRQGQGKYDQIQLGASRDRPYPDKGPWNPYANFVGYDFDKQEYTFSKVNSMYGSICFRFPPDIPFPMACDVLITGSGYWEPITVSAVYDPWNKDSPIQWGYFSYDTKGDEVSFAYRTNYSNSSHYDGSTVHFATVSDQTSIVMLTLDVPQPSSY